MRLHWGTVAGEHRQWLPPPPNWSSEPVEHYEAGLWNCRPVWFAAMNAWPEWHTTFSYELNMSEPQLILTGLPSTAAWYRVPTQQKQSCRKSLSLIPPAEQYSSRFPR